MDALLYITFIYKSKSLFSCLVQILLRTIVQSPIINKIMLRRERACLQKLKKIFSRQNGLVLLLILVEFMVLALRFVGDFRTGGVIDITPDLIIPYAEECTNDDRGARVENFTGLFATTRWIDLPRGSYQVCINYVNDGEDGEVSFLDEIMPTAQYDAAKLPAERTRTVFSLWMPYGCETAQLQFTADCGKNQVIYITGAQIVPTHAWAYVRLLTGLVFCAVLDWVILLLTRRVKFPIHTLRGRYIAMALVGIGVFACLPLGLGYLTYGHDLSIHLSRIEGLKAGLLAGQFPVRMDPAIINEKGYPFSLMYSDVFLYPAAVLRILGFSLQTSYKVYVASITAATVGITFLCPAQNVPQRLCRAAWHRVVHPFVLPADQRVCARRSGRIYRHGVPAAGRVRAVADLSPISCRWQKGRALVLAALCPGLYRLAAEPSADNRTCGVLYRRLLPAVFQKDLHPPGAARSVQSRRGRHCVEPVVYGAAAAIHGAGGVPHQRQV